MSIIIPSMGVDHQRIPVRPKMVRVTPLCTLISIMNYWLTLSSWLYFVVRHKLCQKQLQKGGLARGFSYKQYSLLTLHCVYHLCPQESETILERYRRRMLDNLLELHNKTPVWNDGTCASIPFSAYLLLKTL
jgi:hypothetical protein